MFELRPVTQPSATSSFRMRHAILYLALAVAFHGFFILWHRPASTSSPIPNGWKDAPASIASQGRLWAPVVFRQYNGPRQTFRTSKLRLPKPGPACSQWAVVTTIFAPTSLLHQLRALPDWCVVVVGDERTDHTKWEIFVDNPDTTVYLSPTHQKALRYTTLQNIPWNHFGRKNVGFLYAIHRGAELIWDTDDDNKLLDPDRLSAFSNFTRQENKSVPLAAGNHHLFNPYPAFRPIRSRTARPEIICWPRGFPLEYVKDVGTSDQALSGEVKVSDIGVWQSLANKDPDVDAVYRLTKEIPLSFVPPTTGEVATGKAEKPEEHAKASVALMPGRVAPFNAQATLWTRRAFWGLLLPVSVHGRVTDIWRSYIVQRLMSGVGLHVAFTEPLVVQHRNVHSLTADLQAEIPLYTMADELTKWLREWKPRNETAGIAQRTEQLFIDLYEIGVLEESDVKLTQMWMEDLLAVGYKFPEVTRPGENIAPEDKVKEPDVKSIPNTAVCVSGQVRTLVLELENDLHPNAWHQMESGLPKPNMTVAESIQRNLFPKLGNVDVFMTVSTLETTKEPKVGDLSVCEPLRPSNGLLECAVPKEQEAPAWKQGELWREFILANVSERQGTTPDVVIQGFLQQLKGMFDCYAMIRRHSLKTGKTYDWIVRMRPDNYVYAFPKLERLVLDTNSPTVWFGNFEDCCCGNEDRFAIAPSRWMEEYLTRFTAVQEIDWFCTQDNCAQWKAEMFLEFYLKTYGIALLAHPEISLCSLKPLDRKARSDP